MKDFSSKLFVGLSLVVSSTGVCTGCTAGADYDAEAVELRADAFTNQYNEAGWFCDYANCEPLHEEITVAALSFLKRDVANYIANANARFDRRSVFAADAHFDNCTFLETSIKVRRLYERAVAQVGSSPSVGCETYYDDQCSPAGDSSLDYFGRLLHPIQDFYTHTNWVESERTVLFDSSVGSFPLLVPYALVGLSGMRIVELGSREWTLRRAASGAGYPGGARFVVQNGVQTNDALLSGNTTGGGASEPHRCPAVPGRDLTHEFLAKDGRRPNPERNRYFDRALQLATQQTRHEWCRFQNLVYEGHGADGVRFVCENWVEDAAAANAECPSLPAEARCEECSAAGRCSFLFNSVTGSCSQGAAETSGTTYGTVVIDTTVEPLVTARVEVKANPNTEYSIWLNQDPGDCPTTPTASVITNAEGIGTGSVTKTRVPGAVAFWVSAVEEPYVAGMQVLRSVAR
jgi:hypothetical protein